MSFRKPGDGFWSVTGAGNSWWRISDIFMT
jgi:hypothetical protein